MTVSTFPNRAQKQKIENKIRWKTGYEYFWVLIYSWERWNDEVTSLIWQRKQMTVKWQRHN